MKIMMTICAAALAICGTLGAQSATFVDHVTVRFSTPVVVGTTTVPAGECSIQVVRGSSDNLFLSFRSESGARVSVLVSRLNELDNDTQFTGDQPRIILSRHGDQYRFERILMPDHSGFEVLPNVE
jgi:hypothetical protein